MTNEKRIPDNIPEKMNESSIRGFVLSFYIFVLLWLFLFFTISYKAHEDIWSVKAGILFFTLILIFLWAVVIAISPDRYRSHFFAYSMIFSLHMMSAYFTLYYIVIYKILKLLSPLYIVAPIIGCIVIVASYLIYEKPRYSKEELEKRKATSYGYAISGTIIGGTLLKLFFSKSSETSKDFISAILILVFVYIFGILAGIAAKRFLNKDII